MARGANERIRCEADGAACGGVHLHCAGFEAAASCRLGYVGVRANGGIRTLACPGFKAGASSTLGYIRAVRGERIELSFACL
jgi:hypothetical protein